MSTAGLAAHLAWPLEPLLERGRSVSGKSLASEMAMRMPSLLIVAAFAAATAALPVQAQSCAAEIDALAQRHALATELPRAEPPSGAPEQPPGVSPESLARSGGVIAPPGEGRGRVIEPPRSGGDAMPTAPAVPPQTSQAPSTGSAEISAAKRAQMQSLLDGARAAEREGNEAECRKRLDEARAIPETR